MGKLLVALLAVVVGVEVVAVVGVAAALFWIGGRGTVAVGATMLIVTAIAGLLTLRTIRRRGYRQPS